MDPFIDSSELRNSPEALQARLSRDGYLFLRQVLDAATLLELRRQITEVLFNAGWLRQGSDPMAAIPDIVPFVEGEEEYLQVLDEVQKLQAFHHLAHEPVLLGLMHAIVGETAFPHPLAIARLVFPDYDEWSTPPHQDFPNNQGTKDLFAAWIPLGDCPLSAGPISVLHGSHRHGLLPLEFALGAGHRQAVLADSMQDLPWHGGDFAIGDVLVFHSHTVHRALDNRGSSMRLSVDYRYQAEGQPLTEACLQPHFRRLDWEEVYAGWQDRSLCYYWQEKDYEVVPWDESLHKLSAEQDSKAMRLAVASEWARNRRRH